MFSSIQDILSYKQNLILCAPDHFAENYCRFAFKLQQAASTVDTKVSGLGLPLWKAETVLIIPERHLPLLLSAHR
ncbi:MAG: hypothetical protein SCJ97_05620 [Bacillota bacterium]|nr:hypothetical protein [Bacillota bacterium]